MDNYEVMDDVQEPESEEYTKWEAIKDILEDTVHQIKMVLSDSYRERVQKEEEQLSKDIEQAEFEAWYEQPGNAKRFWEGAKQAIDEAKGVK